MSRTICQMVIYWAFIGGTISEIGIKGREVKIAGVLAGSGTESHFHGGQGTKFHFHLFTGEREQKFIFMGERESRAKITRERIRRNNTHY